MTNWWLCQVKRYKEKIDSNMGFRVRLLRSPYMHCSFMTYTSLLPFIVAFDSTDPDAAVSNRIPVILQRDRPLVGKCAIIR